MNFQRSTSQPAIKSQTSIQQDSDHKTSSLMDTVKNGFFYMIKHIMKKKGDDSDTQIQTISKNFQEENPPQLNIAKQVAVVPFTVATQNSAKNGRLRSLQRQPSPKIVKKCPLEQHLRKVELKTLQQQTPLRVKKVCRRVHDYYRKLYFEERPVPCESKENQFRSLKLSLQGKIKLNNMELKSQNLINEKKILYEEEMYYELQRTPAFSFCEIDQEDYTGTIEHEGRKCSDVDTMLTLSEFSFSKRESIEL